MPDPTPDIAATLAELDRLHERMMRPASSVPDVERFNRAAHIHYPVLRAHIATLTARNESLAVELRERYRLLQEHRAELLAQAERLAEVEGENELLRPALAVARGYVAAHIGDGNTHVQNLAGIDAALAKPTETETKGEKQ